MLLSYIGQIGKQMKRDSRQQNTDQDKIRGGRGVIYYMQKRYNSAIAGHCKIIVRGEGSYITYRTDITLPWLDTGHWKIIVKEWPIDISWIGL